MVRVLCLLIGYCFGLIQTAFILGKIHGIDIRKQGSGNSGTTNALRVLGKKAGAICFVMDAVKGHGCGKGHYSYGDYLLCIPQQQLCADGAAFTSLYRCRCGAWTQFPVLYGL